MKTRKKKANKYQTLYVELDGGEIVFFHGPVSIKENATITNISASKPKDLTTNIAFNPDTITLKDVWHQLL